MNYLIVVCLIVVSLLFTPSLSQAKTDREPLCQAKLLKVTSEALHAALPSSVKGVYEISQITFNYGLKGRPRIVIMNRRASDSSRVCLIEVYTNVAGQDEDDCPLYVFESIESNCEQNRD